MRVRLSVFSALLAFGLMPAGMSADSGAETFAPKDHGIERYAAVWKRSPFIVETVAVQVSVGLAGKYALVGMASLAGKPIVFLVDKTNMDAGKNRFLVSQGKANEQGIDLVSVGMNADPRQSSAVIQQAGQQAKLVFDPASLAPQGPAVGAVPPASSGLVRPPGIPQPPAQLPLTAPSNGAPGSPTAPPPGRRIIRPAPVNLNN